MSNHDRGCCCNCGCPTTTGTAKRRGGIGTIFRAVFSMLLIYGTLVFGSGTLIKTGNPVAVEAGRLIQVVTFVEPTINWAHGSGHHGLANGIDFLSSGIRIG